MKISEVPVSGIFVYNNCRYQIEDVDFENDILYLISSTTGKETSIFFPNVELDNTTYFIPSGDDAHIAKDVTLTDDDIYNICESLEYLLIKEASSYEKYVSSKLSINFEIQNEDDLEESFENNNISHVYKSAALGLRAISRN